MMKRAMKPEHIRPEPARTVSFDLGSNRCKSKRSIILANVVPELLESGSLPIKSLLRVSGVSAKGGSLIWPCRQHMPK